MDEPIRFIHHLDEELIDKLVRRIQEQGKLKLSNQLEIAINIVLWYMSMGSNATLVDLHSAVMVIKRAKVHAKDAEAKYLKLEKE